MTSKVMSTNDAIALAKCREVLATRSKNGHSDLGDFLFAYLRGEDSLETFLWQCNATWLGSQEPAPAADKSTATLSEDKTYVVDAFGNRADIVVWGSEKNARDSLATLSNCIRCVNCQFCADCDSCENCRGCEYCRHCKSCECCTNCRHCKKCIHCENCLDCTNCVQCASCTRCTDCKECKSCLSCTRCNSCKKCQYCTDCKTCKNCKACVNCQFCVKCVFCDDCKNCIELDHKIHLYKRPETD